MELNVLAIFLISFFGVIVVSAICYRFGQHCKDKDHKKPSTVISSSIFALLGLIMSFSFSMAISRYDDRRKLHVEEANAIGTAYLRATLLKQVPGIDIRDLYRSYLEERILFYEEDFSLKRIANAQLLQKEIWKHLQKVAESERNNIVANYSTALNEMIDVASSRNYATMKRIPIPIYGIIFFMACIAFGILHYERGLAEDRSHIGAVAFILLFALLHSLIFDFDHGRRGIIRISQQAMLETRDLMTL
jgi:hypothetical protein